MKKLLIATLFGWLALAACTDTASDEFCNDPNAKCPDLTAIEATSCCTDQECYWIYNGEKYTCSGENCQDAINQIVASACAANARGINIHETDLEILRAQLQDVTNQLMIEARAASGCAY